MPYISNHSYFPILVQPDYPLSRDALYEAMYRGLPSAAPENLPVATKLALQVICLPLFPAMTDDDVMRVIDVIQSEGTCLKAG